MKRILYITFLALTLSACTDFIEEVNLSNVTAESFYVTADGYNTLINANYSELRNIYGNDAYVFCAGTDLYAVGAGRGTEPEGLSRYIDLNSASEDVDQLYASCNKAIQTANIAISYAEITEKTSDLAQKVGEVKFMRANAYFLLVQTYGGVSLITDYISTPVLSFDRNSAEEIYAQIITDLNEALSVVSDGSYTGRVNKRAVRHLLAKVHLTRAYESFGTANDFTLAASLAEEAIGGQELSIDFNELWTPGNEMNDEVLFSVQYSTSSISVDPTEYGNKQANWFGPYLGGTEVAGDAGWRSYSLLATDFALGLYSKEDTRYETTFMTKAYSRYYDYFDVADKSGLQIRHYYVPSWVSQAELDEFILANPETQIHPFGTYGAKPVSGDYETIPAKKFDDPAASFVSGGNTSSRDIILSRLAETYLISAEAHLNTNPALGLERLNAVRARAGVPAATAGEFDIDYILDERARELFGEYHRWFDLKRTGKLVERASLHNYLIEEGNFVGANGELKILRPIPQSALDLNQNKNFAQNPAYN